MNLLGLLVKERSKTSTNEDILREVSAEVQRLAKGIDKSEKEVVSEELDRLSQILESIADECRGNDSRGGCSVCGYGTWPF